MSLALLYGWLICHMCVRCTGITARPGLIITGIQVSSKGLNIKLWTSLARPAFGGFILNY